MTSSPEQLVPESAKTPPNIARGAAFATTAPHKRTLGEKAVDFIVYPFVNNFLVIGTSVIATYLTQRGNTIGKEGGMLRKIGSGLNSRGKPIQNVLENNLHLDTKAAEMGNMVFWSFADGTLLTPFVKLLEDRREGMARWVDSHFGDKQPDELVYKTEPKQTWKSVISGRLASLSIVLPTAIALNQKVGNRSLNDRIFDKPSEKVAELLENTSIKKRFPNIDTKFFSKTLLFEAVYTSICTAGLYYISRYFVKKSKTHKERVQEYTSNHQPTTMKEDSARIASTQKDEPNDRPLANISSASHVARVANPPTAQEITA